MPDQSFGQQNCLSVVMPVYNEEATLEQIINLVLEIPNLLEVIIIDDFSTDKTPSIGRNLAANDKRVHYIRQTKNGGKTEALKTGFAVSRGEVIIVQDADLEYDPQEIAGVIAPILDGSADVVYGSRFMRKRTASIFYFRHFLANKGLTFLSNCLTHLHITDVETCYKAFRGNIVRNMIITSSGFGFEIEVTAKVAKLKCAVQEVPISYFGRTYNQGKKIKFKDGLAALWYVFKFNLAVDLANSYRSTPEFSTASVNKQFCSND